MVAEALSWKKWDAYVTPRPSPGSEKPARTKVTDSFTTPGSIQPFVWCGDEIRPQPNLEAPLAVIVYTVTKSHLNSLLQLFLFLFLPHCIYLPPSCGTYLCSRLVASVSANSSLPSLYMKTSSVVTVTKQCYSKYTTCTCK